MSIRALDGRTAWASATVVLIWLNVAVAAAMVLFGAEGTRGAYSVQLAWGANFGPATTDGEWWRLGTAMFLHFGPLHLAMNMLALWDSGRYVENLFGKVRFAIVFFASGLVGNLVSLAAHGDGAVSGGASGAVFGVYGALLMYLLLARRRIHPADFRWLFWGAAIFSVATLVLGLLVPGIDNAAHAGGLAAGAVTGYMLVDSTNSLDPPPHAGRLILAACFVIALGFIVLYLPAPRYDWSEEKVAREEIRDFIDEDARINARLRRILSSPSSQGTSFDQLAGRIEAEVAQSYDRSFDQLSSLHLSPEAPSAETLDRLKRYAEARRDASHALAEGLRDRDTNRIRDAINSARRAAGEGKETARRAEPSP